MANNTRERSNELRLIAEDIGRRHNINPASLPIDNSLYILELSVLGRCHPETARKVWSRYLNHDRRCWGGKRKNAGRKPFKPNPLGDKYNEEIQWQGDSSKVW